jgi:hypothetical protein
LCVAACTAEEARNQHSHKVHTVDGEMVPRAADSPRPPGPMHPFPQASNEHPLDMTGIDDVFTELTEEFSDVLQHGVRAQWWMPGALPGLCEGWDGICALGAEVGSISSGGGGSASITPACCCQRCLLSLNTQRKASPCDLACASRCCPARWRRASPWPLQTTRPASVPGGNSLTPSGALAPPAIVALARRQAASCVLPCVAARSSSRHGGKAKLGRIVWIPLGLFPFYRLLVTFVAM